MLRAIWITLRHRLTVAVTMKRRFGALRPWPLAGSLLVLAWSWMAAGADLQEAQGKFLSGDYDGCITLARQAVHESPDNEEWQLLLCRALLATGQYPEARAAITNALASDRYDLRLHWQAREVFQFNGQADAAAAIPEEIVRIVSRHTRDYNNDPPSLVVFGQAALAEGADPKRVLDTIFDGARKKEPKLREVYLAGGELALEKHDFALAAKKFGEGLKELPDDPDLHFGLARAYAPSDQALMAASLETALQRNSNHVGSLLLLVDHNIDAEDYSGAEELLDRLKAINPWQPDAWAYRAVLAHLQNQPQAEEKDRQTALMFWPANPRVDYLIGQKLSQNYRFAEGAAHQRQALQFEADYLPAKAQLAQDLLRLGEEAEGWKLAEQVQKQDGYDVEAYNLAALHDVMGNFATLTNHDFLVRMSRHEAEVYGAQVLGLLTQARSNLCAKYGMEVKRPTYIEIFPEHKDFEVRTFGMPGNPGYLGVCFGTVITANSPAAHPGHAVNWQAVLWHEFCHVVTLQMTRNKMPRWLSEGISVYEEGQRNPAWGQQMNPRYREMVLGDELTPVSKLSAAFVSPKSDLHVQFAYYESSLVVEFIVQRFGLERLQAILRDLGEGAEINQAIASHTEPIEKIEEDFAGFARERAQQLAPGMDWEKLDLAQLRRRAAADAQPQAFHRVLTDTPLPAPATTNAPLSLAFTNTTATNAEAVSGGTPNRPLHPGPAIPGPRTDETEFFAQLVASHPTNFYALNEQAQCFLLQKQFQEAKTPLQKLTDLYPAQKGSDSAWAMLASAHRALGETNAEHRVLARLAEQDDAAPEAYARLMELDAAAQDWPAVLQNAYRYLAVDPLVASPYRFLAQASERTGEAQTAILAYRVLLQLNPLDPAEMHFRLAELLHRAGDPEAKRHVLQALEEAPRYRAALRLLLEIENESLQTSVESEARLANAAAKP
jgi:tetratricopeptide (TPR) repeat protein